MASAMANNVERLTANPSTAMPANAPMIVTGINVAAAIGIFLIPVLHAVVQWTREKVRGPQAPRETAQS